MSASARRFHPGPFVVNFGPGLYGPFATRDEATDWACAHVDELTARFRGGGAITYSWEVVPVHTPDPVGGR